jgi:hypothetical protein
MIDRHRTRAGCGEQQAFKMTTDTPPVGLRCEWSVDDESHAVGARRVIAATIVVIGASALLSAQVTPKSVMNEIAEQYVRLVLAVGQHDADYVDAFYGPAEWKSEAERRKIPLEQIASDAKALNARLRRLAPAARRDPGGIAGDDDLEPLRREYLDRQLAALEARVRMLSGARLTFDEESKALYDAVAPEHPAAYFNDVLRELEALLPGAGALINRYDRFRRDFVIPPDRLAGVFDRAIQECRTRTLKHVALPATETFTLEYVTGKSWSGYNWYQGNYHSLIQVNTDLPIYIERAVDLACHEGYPGHHVYNVMLEKNLVRDRGWIEFTAYPLFSPQSLIAEGTANYGIEVAFPGEQRAAFERDVLFPLAGLPPERAALYDRVQALADKLAYAGNEAARAYVDGRLNRAQAAQWLVDYAMTSPPRAEQRIRFVDQYRSYIINYNLGKDLVKDYIESRAAGDADRRWAEFARLLASPRLPSGLQAAPTK